MGAEIAGDNETGKACSQAAEQLAFAAEEIKTAADFARFMTGVMAALLKRQIDSATATAICGTANTMLKAIEMQVKYGQLNKNKQRELYLTEAPAVTDIVEIPHVTSVTSKPAVSQKSDIPADDPEEAERKIPAKKGTPWCNDCYVGRKLYITASEEVEGDPLCLPCANKRRKHLDPEYDSDKVSSCLTCEKEGKSFKTGSPTEWVLHMKMRHGAELDLASVNKAWGK